MQRFRIATYNIHKARGMDGRVRIHRIARVLEEIEADVVALQEVVDQEGAAPEDHQSCYLAEKLGYFRSMGETRKHRITASYGNVTLSKWDFDSTRHINLTVPRREPRGALKTDIRVGRHLVHFFNVHLGTAFHERRTQARLIDHYLLKAVDISGHRVVLGDFNDWTHGLVTQTLTAEFHLNDIRTHLKTTRMYPGFLPLLHLDHIYLDQGIRIESARFHRSATAVVASDHLPLVADLSFRD